MDIYNKIMTMSSFVIILIVWSTIWKGLALWRAARREQKFWYVFLLLFNTAGILEILYLFVFSRLNKTKK